MGGKNERKFFSVECKLCGEEAVVEADDEGEAELIWDEYKNCGHNAGVQVLPTEETTDRQEYLCAYPWHRKN